MIVGIAFSRRSRGYYPAFAAASAEYAGEVGSLYLFNRRSSILALSSILYPQNILQIQDKLFRSNDNSGSLPAF